MKAFVKLCGVILIFGGIAFFIFPRMAKPMNSNDMHTKSVKQLRDQFYEYEEVLNNVVLILEEKSEVQNISPSLDDEGMLDLYTVKGRFSDKDFADSYPELYNEMSFLNSANFKWISLNITQRGIEIYADSVQVKGVQAEEFFYLYCKDYQDEDIYYELLSGNWYLIANTVGLT